MSCSKFSDEHYFQLIAELGNYHVLFDNNHPDYFLTNIVNESQIKSHDIFVVVSWQETADKSSLPGTKTKILCIWLFLVWKLKVNVCHPPRKKMVVKKSLYLAEIRSHVSCVPVRTREARSQALRKLQM